MKIFVDGDVVQSVWRAAVQRAQTDRGENEVLRAVPIDKVSYEASP